MSKVMAVARGLLLLAAVLPGVAMASLTAANLNFGNVVQGTTVTKSVTVTGSSGGHYILDPSGYGSMATITSGTCPTGPSSSTVTACQLEVTLTTSANTSLGSGSENPYIGYIEDNMPFSPSDEGYVLNNLYVAVSYTIVEPDSDGDGVANGATYVPAPARRESRSIWVCG